jgi:hypothetical protein
MEAGTHVWCTADAKGDEAWILAEVLQKGEFEIELKQVDKPENTFTRELMAKDEETGAIKFKGVELANTPLSEEERAAGADNDLITLPHLHEPAILHAVSERFKHGSIYTWTGPVIIAVNPFQRLPLYTDVSYSICLFSVLSINALHADVILIFPSHFFPSFFFKYLRFTCYRKFVNITEVKDCFDHKAWVAMVNWNRMFSQSPINPTVK